MVWKGLTNYSTAEVTISCKYMFRLHQQSTLAEIEKMESIAHERIEALASREQQIAKEEMRLMTERETLKDLKDKTKMAEEKALRLQQSAQEKLEVNIRSNSKSSLKLQFFSHASLFQVQFSGSCPYIGTFLRSTTGK